MDLLSMGSLLERRYFHDARGVQFPSLTYPSGRNNRPRTAEKAVGRRMGST